MAAHPFLLAIVPIVYLYSRNQDEASVATALIFAAGALALTAVVMLATWLWQGSLLKAALLASLFNVLFFAYGHVFDFLMQHEPVSMSYDHWHLLLLAICITILATTGLLLRRIKWNPGQLSRFLTGAMAILLLMCAVKIAHHKLRILIAGRRHHPVAASPAPQVAAEPRIAPLTETTATMPDVYYIILDGYARADTLQRICHCDNSEFLDFLRSRGFFVADQSCANYPMTFMSIASSLNMRYLDDELKSPGYSAVYAMWDRPAVAQEFQSKGYQFIYLATNFKSTMDGADFVFQPRPSWLLNQFAESELRTTALRFLEAQMADQHLYEFETVQQVPRIPGPKFTFCHIIAPHPPYVFDRNGHICQDVPQSMFFKDGWEEQQNASSEAAKKAYIEQLLYMNKRIEEVVDNILARSKVPPIILIQGDHGTFFTLPKKVTEKSLDEFALERMPILNAYLVPEKMRKKIAARHCTGQFISLAVQRVLWRTF